MKNEHRFCESCIDRPQSCTMRWAGFFDMESSAAFQAAWSANFLPFTTFSASTATNKCKIAPCLGRVPNVSRHSLSSWNPFICGSSWSWAGKSFTVSNGVAFDTTAFLALSLIHI